MMQRPAHRDACRHCDHPQAHALSSSGHQLKLTVELGKCINVMNKHMRQTLTLALSGSYLRS